MFLTSIRGSTEWLLKDADTKAAKAMVSEDKKETATFKKDKRFIGWRIVGRKEFDKLKKKGFGDKNERIQSALDNIQHRLRNFSEDDLEPVFVDRSSADIWFYGGKRGSGKSVHLRKDSDRSHKSGVNTAIIDTEHEFYTKTQYNGVQDKIRYTKRGKEGVSKFDKLRDGEVAEPLDDVVILIPRFVKELRDEHGIGREGYQDAEFFSWGFSDLDENDVAFVFRDPLTSSGGGNSLDVMNIIRELRERIEEDEIHSWENVKRVIKEMEENEMFQFHDRYHQLATFIQYNLQGKGYFKGESVDLASMFEENNTVILSLNEEQNSPDELKMPELYASIFIKKIRNGLVSGEIDKPVNLLVDEVDRFAPASADPDLYPSKKQLIRVGKRDRKRGLRMITATQNPKSVDHEGPLLQQASRVFIPWNMTNRRKYMLDVAGVLKRNDGQREKWERIFSAMPTYSWLYCDRDVSPTEWSVFIPASPITHHMTE